MPDREKLIALMRNVIKFHEEAKEKWILAGKQGERPSLIASIADNLLANGVTIQRWIPVEERLPEDDVEVLTRRATGMSVESRCGFGWVYDEYNGRWEVTHWMPLPQPPKEVE